MGSTQGIGVGFDPGHEEDSRLRPSRVHAVVVTLALRDFWLLHNQFPDPPAAGPANPPAI